MSMANENLIIEYIGTCEVVAVSDLVSYMDLSDSGVRKVLRRLVDSGYVKRKAEPGYVIEWSLTEWGETFYKALQTISEIPEL